ncbi:MAG: hypothetical protein Q8P58_02045 [Candidatus Adlerbacteria bacterium]|nr:hypothetical protein [Candidatus Adlerbacteria bacterium]MDZ4226049.1 hypothetical protein [Patescibacteria group bacterium]
MQNSTLVWIILAALVILGGGWYFLSSKTTPPAEPVGEEEISTGSGMLVPGVEGGIEADTDVFGDSEESGAPMTAQISYSGSGFLPSTVIVRAGGTVTWSAQSGGQMWVASASHPTHTVYDSTTLQEHCDTGDSSFDQCKNGSTYSFTFTKSGTWRYHNHSNPNHFGTVIVEE